MQLLFKNIFDIIAGIIGCIIFLPLIIIVAIIVRLDSKGNPFFVQKRAGLNGKIFTIFKIRTLYIAHFGIFADQNTPADFRITRIGKYLRRSKLDELPQLLNIALGHMSLVGPRPIAADFLKTIDINYERLTVKPGLTGITQVCGNLELPWHQRIWLDVRYIRNWSLAVDLKILFATIPTLIFGDSPHRNYLNLRSKFPEENEAISQKIYPALKATTKFP